MKKMPMKWYTSSEVAEILGFSPDYIRKLIAKGRLVAEKRGRNYFMRAINIAKVSRLRRPKKGRKNGNDGSN